MLSQSKLLSENNKSLPNFISLTYLFIALFALSFAAIFIKLSEQEIGPNATVFNRLWIAAIVLGLWSSINISRNPQIDEATVEIFPKTAKEIFLLALVGIVGTASVVCWAWSLTETSVANSTLMRNLSPIFTCLQGWLFFKHKFDSRFLIGMVLAIIGATLIASDDIQLGIEHIAGDVIALFAALFYALNLLILEYLRSQFSAVNLLFWRCTIGAIMMLPIVWLTEDKFFPDTWHCWLVIIAFAIICQAFGQVILIHNLKKFSSGFIAVFLLLEPLMTAVFAWMIFGETLNWVNALAFSIVLAGIYLTKSSQNVEKVTLKQLDSK